MRPARAAVVRNIKNVAAGSIYYNKINLLPFTSKDSDDYYKSINQSGPTSCSTLKCHSLSIRFKIFWENVSMGEFNPELEEGVRSQTGKEVKEPPLYKVLLLNDDYTTMDFVVEVLRFVFHKSVTDATHIMLNVHHNGVGLCGIYSFEVAETKVSTVEALARERGFPLKCTSERE